MSAAERGGRMVADETVVSSTTVILIGRRGLRQDLRRARNDGFQWPAQSAGPPVLAGHRMTIRRRFIEYAASARERTRLSWFAAGASKDGNREVPHVEQQLRSAEAAEG